MVLQPSGSHEQGVHLGPQAKKNRLGENYWVFRVNVTGHSRQTEKIDHDLPE